MELNHIISLIKFFDQIKIQVEDISTEEERKNGQKVVIVTYKYNNKEYRTRKLYYKDIAKDDFIKDKDKVISHFGDPVYWLDLDKHKWPKGPGEVNVEKDVIEDLYEESDTEFCDFLLQLGNNSKNGYITQLTSDGRSGQYSFNLENNNHWHDLIIMIKEYICSKGNDIDEKYFSPLVFEWEKNMRKSLSKDFGARKLINQLQMNIKNAFKENEKINKINEVIDLLKFKKQIILQGPPGTGKTRFAKQIADKMKKPQIIGSSIEIINQFFKDYNSNDENIVASRENRKKLLDQFMIKFPIQEIKDLSPSDYCMGKGDNSSFCWWIESGLKSLGKYTPGNSKSYLMYWDKKSESYRKSGFIKDIEDAEEAIKTITHRLSEIIIEKKFENVKGYFGESFILKILNSYYPQEYFPLNGKSYIDNALKIFGIKANEKSIFEKNMELMNQFRLLKTEFKKEIDPFEFMFFLTQNFNLKTGEEIDTDNQLIMSGDSKLIQFHPAYSYEDFVRGITAGSEDGVVSYQVENKILANFAQFAVDNPKGNYVLIIDEINRANLPSVLGELIFALEYRDNPVETLYELEGDKTIILPKNLYLIGTMNTADRSTGHIDYAIRRRFAFINMHPDIEVIKEIGSDESILLFKKVANLFYKNYDESTKELVGSEYLSPEFKPDDVMIGHSYFLEKDNAKLKIRLNFEIKPILREYVKDGILIGENISDEIEKLSL
jgi:5-methylcytosine-specific restriction enzyme B